MKFIWKVKYTLIIRRLRMHLPELHTIDLTGRQWQRPGTAAVQMFVAPPHHERREAVSQASLFIPLTTLVASSQMLLSRACGCGTLGTMSIVKHKAENVLFSIEGTTSCLRIEGFFSPLKWAKPLWNGLHCLDCFLPANTQLCEMCSLWTQLSLLPRRLHISGSYN